MRISNILIATVAMICFTVEAYADAMRFPQEPIYIPPDIYNDAPQYNPNSPNDILIGPAPVEPSVNFSFDLNVAPQPVYEEIQPSYDPLQDRHVGAYGSRPLNPRAFHTWHVRGANESFEWYLANIVGVVYQQQHEGVISDINGDGYPDKVYLVEINPGGFYDTRYQFVSVWINYATEYEVHNGYVDGLYSGIVVDRGQIQLVDDRLGRRSFVPYRP